MLLIENAVQKTFYTAFSIYAYRKMWYTAAYVKILLHKLRKPAKKLLGDFV